MSFKPTEAAFEGFRIVRRRPLALIGWSLLCIVVTGVTLVLAFDRLSSFMAAVKALEGVTEPSGADMERLGRLYAGLLGWAVPLGVAFGAVLNAAIARAVLTPGADAFGYMRLGMDEVRVAVATFVVALVMGLAASAVFGVVVLLAGVAVTGGQSALAGLAILLGLGGVVLLAWMAVRLSLVVPITVAEKRIAPFESWTLTKGRTLPLIGMAVIAFAMSMVVSFLGSVVFMPLTLSFGAGLEGLGAYEGVTIRQALSTAAAPLAILVIVNGILTAMQTAIIYAPFAAAYRDIKGLAAD